MGNNWLLIDCNFVLSIKTGQLFNWLSVKLKVENELLHFQLSNYKLDIITLNHLKQHMLSGELLSIESQKINGENNITKISDIDGILHGQLYK